MEVTKSPSSSVSVSYTHLLRDFTADHSISGALQKLDYLKNMGVDAIELMPVQEFDGNDKVTFVIL